MEKVIEVDDLVKKYGDLTAVDRISFDVYKDEVFSLVGPNGAGKTTTVEILECLLEPTSGRAEVFGYDVGRDEEKIKGRIGVLPQEFNTFERLSVKENVALTARIYGSEENIGESLEAMELQDFEDKQFGELSGGMKRRVGIAMALVSYPDLLFLDEPTTGLDPQARRRMWDMIKGLSDFGVTVFLTTHYMEEVEELCDRSSVILKGRILSTDTVDGLISKYGGDMKIVVRDGANARTVLEEYADDLHIGEEGELTGTFESREKAAEAHLAIYRNCSEDCEVDLEKPSMDDVFLNVAGARLDDSGELVE